MEKMGGKYFIPLPIRVKALIERLTSFMTFLKLKKGETKKRSQKLVRLCPSTISRLSPGDNQAYHTTVSLIIHLLLHPISVLRHSNTFSPAAPFTTRYLAKPRTTSATSSFVRPWTAVSITPPTLALCTAIKLW